MKHHKQMKDIGPAIKRTMKRLIVLPMICLTTVLYAEELGVEEVNPGNGEALVPLDGGASLLLAAAAGLGAYRLNRDGKKVRPGHRDRSGS